MWALTSLLKVTVPEQFLIAIGRELKSFSPVCGRVLVNNWVPEDNLRVL